MGEQAREQRGQMVLAGVEMCRAWMAGSAILKKRRRGCLAEWSRGALGWLLSYQGEASIWAVITGRDGPCWQASRRCLGAPGWGWSQ